MGISEQLRRFRLRLRRAWQTIQGQADTKLENMPVLDIQNPDLAAIHAKARQHMADIMRDDVLEQELVDDIIRETQEQTAALDDAMRGHNGHDRLPGGDNDKTAQL